MKDLFVKKFLNFSEKQENSHLDKDYYKVVIKQIFKNSSIKDNAFINNQSTTKDEESSVNHNSLTEPNKSPQQDLSSYPDYTEPIIQSIQEEMKTAEDYCDEMKSLGDNQYSVTALAWYFKTFQNNGYMDVKHKTQWESKFPDTPYPSKDGIFVFKDDKTTPEQLGNILYGMVGRKMGFSPRLIYQGSGFAAGATGEMLNSSENYYGDSKEDYMSVKRGVESVENEEVIEFDLSLIPPKILKLLKRLS